jgi:hypothetical protein
MIPLMSSPGELEPFPVCVSMAAREGTTVEPGGYTLVSETGDNGTAAVASPSCPSTVECGSGHSLGARNMATIGRSGEVTMGGACQGAMLEPSGGLETGTVGSEGDPGSSKVATFLLGALAPSSFGSGVLLGAGMLGGILVGGHSQGPLPSEGPVRSRVIVSAGHQWRMPAIPATWRPR